MYAKGLIATTGCPSGEIQTRLRLGRLRRRVQGGRGAAGHLRPGVLLLRDDGPRARHRAPGPRRSAPAGRRARDPDRSPPTTCTTPIAADAESHEVLLCVQSGKTMADPNRFKFDARDFYLKTAQEMRAVWRDLPEACDNTLLIAERCEVKFDENADLLPRFAGAGGAYRGDLAAGRGRARAGVALPGRRSGRAPRARRLRARRHGADGLPGLLPRRRRPVPARPRVRHPGRPGPRLGRRVAGRRTRCGSPSSTRSSTACCSSGSSTPSACRCPTSTSTSTSAGAAT